MLSSDSVNRTVAQDLDEDLIRLVELLKVC
jgi:hypothetical protein